MNAKKLAAIMIINSLVATIVFFTVLWIVNRRRNAPYLFFPRSGALAQGGVDLGLLYSGVKYPGINYQLFLSPNTPGATGEIAALQLLINLYNGEKYTEVTGVWNEQTTAALQQIFGRDSTSLYEMRHTALAPLGIVGNDVDNVLNQLIDK